ncbi:MAG: hypothetical protein ABIB04_01165 [Patescibacteria group bacterium]
MEIKEFFKRFIVHLALACAFWYTAVLAMERLMPGSIAPFVNLPAIGLLVFALCVVASIYGREATSTIGVLIIGMLILIGGILWFWTRINDLGRLGMALEATGVVLSTACVYSLFRNQTTNH